MERRTDSVCGRGGFFHILPIYVSVFFLPFFFLHGGYSIHVGASVMSKADLIPKKNGDQTRI